MKESEVKLVKDSLEKASKLSFANIQEWIDHLELNFYNNSHTEVREAICDGLKNLVKAGQIEYQNANTAKTLVKGCKDIDPRFLPSFGDCSDGASHTVLES